MFFDGALARPTLTDSLQMGRVGGTRLIGLEADPTTAIRTTALPDVRVEVVEAMGGDPARRPTPPR